MPDFMQPQIFDISKCKSLQNLVPGTRLADSRGLPLGSKLICYVLEISNGDRVGAHILDKGTTKAPDPSTAPSPLKDCNGLCNFAKVRRPILQSGLISGAMLEAFEVNSDHLQLRKARLKCFAAMLSLAKKLEDEELEQHSAMPQHLQMVLRGQRTLLFE